jgi:PAS domain S-box-containing protein
VSDDLGPADSHGLRLHQELVEALDDYVFMADTSGRLLAVNRKARESLGWELEELGDRTIWDLHPPEDNALVERERWKIVETGASSFQVQLLTRSGRRIPTLGRVTYSPASGTFQGVYRDMTEENLMRERLLQVERLRALGEMASGVAHTFNNLLAVIGTTVQVAKRMTTDPALSQELVAIERAVFDGGAAVRRIQDFVRKRPAEPYRELRLEEIARDALTTATRRLADAGPGAVRIVDELRPVPPVRGSESELRDVLLNLYFNALDAMPHGGELRVTTAAEGDAVWLLVADSGRGMSPEVRERLFTPFFSTKGERGSGLGLAIAANTVSQHGGSIEVESEPGRGTTMRLTLPRARPKDGLERPARVLLVESDPLLRIELMRSLGREGHVLDAAEDETTALALLQAAPYDMVFVEARIAGGGPLPARARARGARVVMLDRWGEAVAEGAGGDTVLRKPFAAAAVLNLVHALAPR